MIKWNHAQPPDMSPFSLDYTPPRRLRLGVVGLGEGRSILAAAKHSRLWEVRGICDLNEELARDRMREFDIESWTPNLDDLLADKGIDVVAIYTPDALHGEHIRRCFSMGKHVICTKPLLSDLTGGAALLAMADASQLKLLVGQSSRFIHPMWRQREDVVSGRHGQIMAVEAHYHGDHRWFFRKPWTRGDGLNEIFAGLSHPVDLVCWHLPEIEEVMGYGLLTPGARDLGQMNPDALHFVMKARDGSLARVSGHYGHGAAPHAIQDMIQCVVRGTHATSVADYSELRYAIAHQETGEEVETYRHWQNYYWRFGGHTHHAGEFENYIDYFARCIHEDIQPEPGLREGLRTIATLVAMDRSVKTGQPIRVADMLEEHAVSALITQ